MCFGGFFLPPVTPKTMSWPNELTRRWTFDEHGSSAYFELPVNKVAINTSISLGRVRWPWQFVCIRTYPDYPPEICYGTDFLHTASAFQLFYSGVEIQHSAVAGSQLSLALKNWRLYMLLLSYDWSESLQSYTNVILTLSTTKAEKLVVNTCGRYFSLAKFELIKLLDKLMATETKVFPGLYANPCGLTAGKLTLRIITLR